MTITVEELITSLRYIALVVGGHHIVKIIDGDSGLTSSIEKVWSETHDDADGSTTVWLRCVVD